VSGAQTMPGVADDEGHLLRRAERGRDDQIALVLAVIVIGDDNDLAAGEGFDGLSDVLLHDSLPRPLQAQKIIGGDGTVRGGGDALGTFARDPGTLIVAERRHAGRRQADLPREGAASHAILPEPSFELHGRKLIHPRFTCNEAGN